MAVPKIKLGCEGFEVSAQGLGCMSMSALYGPPKSEDDMIALIHHAVSKGITFLDTADIYGPHRNELLLGKALKRIRDKVQLATKFGIRFVGEKMEICGDPAYVRASCEGSLKRLDVDCIDLYYQHRVDTTVPIEVTVVTCSHPSLLKSRELILHNHIPSHFFLQHGVLILLLGWRDLGLKHCPALMRCRLSKLGLGKKDPSTFES